MLRIFFVCFLLLPIGLKAQVGEKHQVYSAKMKKNIPVWVISPKQDGSQKQKLPVLYLLHGAYGDASNWPKKVPELQEWAKQYNMLIVCPDGGYTSWYLDSPIDSSMRYETFISKELVSWVDANFETKPNRSFRAISGLSMGGHGALYNAFKHPETFGAVGSMSGGVDLRPFPKNWNIPKRLGSYQSNKENWENYSVINMIESAKSADYAITIDCGVDDFFYKVNQAFHQKLLEHKIEHSYKVMPGAHNWDYWRNSIEFQMLFFHRFFYP